MSTPPVIVNYTQLSRALTSQSPFESKADDLRDAIVASVDDPVEADKILSLFGEALKELEAAEARSSPTVLTTAESRHASLIQTLIAENAEREAKVEETSVGVFEARFDKSDLGGWVKSLWNMLFNKNPFAWKSASATLESIPDHTRVALLGDWGTGLYGAPICANTIEADGQYGMIMHLGDVYYSGTEKEIQERFLDRWPKNQNAIHRALNSNHEMYTGGNAYHDLTLSKFKQKASYFAHQNEKWILVGLDSAYKDHDLFGEQAQWLRGIVAGAGNKKIILFSHHQPFSLLESQGEKLRNQILDLLVGKKIFAWYWGHEHRCVIYDQHPTWGIHGRCIGHGGMPYAREKKIPHAPYDSAENFSSWQRIGAKVNIPGGFMLDGPNQYIEGEEDHFGPNGYMTLEIEGDKLSEILHDPDGTVVYRKQVV